MATASIRMLAPASNAAPSFGRVIARLASVIPSSRMNTVALSWAGSMSKSVHGVVHGQFVGNGHGRQFTTLATTVSMPSGRESLIAMTRITVEVVPAGMDTSDGNSG